MAAAARQSSQRRRPHSCSSASEAEREDAALCSSQQNHPLLERLERKACEYCRGHGGLLLVSPPPCSCDAGEDESESGSRREKTRGNGATTGSRLVHTIRAQQQPVLAHTSAGVFAIATRGGNVASIGTSPCDTTSISSSRTRPSCSAFYFTARPGGCSS